MPGNLIIPIWPEGTPVTLPIAGEIEEVISVPADHRMLRIVVEPTLEVNTTVIMADKTTRAVRSADRGPGRQASSSSIHNQLQRDRFTTPIGASVYELE